MISKEKLEESIHLAAVAFENELTNLFKFEILEIDSEREAYLNTLKNKGLL